MEGSGDKQALRARMVAARRALSAGERARRSAAIAARVAAMPELAEARTVALYAPMGAEVDTGGLAEALARAGVRLVWPRIVAEGRRMELAACAPAELVPGPLGTRQPPAGSAEVDPAAVDLVCVPGVAFDEALHRLGRGGGFYDATLPALTRALRVALAFDLQVLPSLPAGPGDAPVHRIATETRLLGPAGG